MPISDASASEGNLEKLLFLTVVALQLSDYSIKLSARSAFFRGTLMSKSSGWNAAAVTAFSCGKN
jgi:hypothetical protein